MTLGEKIKYLRMKEKITQEVLAEKLNVSRSAIAKWETNSGMPEISNLKMISQIFSISMDELLNDTCEMDNISLEDPQFDMACSEYIGYDCDIELNGWNDGVYNILVVGEDEDFVFYQKRVKEKYLYGLIGKRYITSINRKPKCDKISESLEFEGRNYFCMKHVCIELASKEGLLKGFFDFRSEDYRNVVIRSFAETKVSLKLGGEISIDAITKIEEL